MAFRELSEKEIELLTDLQRKAYEEELAIYRERVKFVEQLEKMEHTEIKPYQPKLTPIPQVSGVPEKQFTKPEHELQQPQAVKLPVPRAEAVKLEPLPEAVVPQVVCKVSVPDVAVPKAGTDAPELPVSAPVRIPQTAIKPAQPAKAEFYTAPTVRAPTVKAVKAEPVKADLEVVEASCAVSAAAKARIPAVPELTDEKPELPQAVVTFAQIPAYNAAAPEMTALPEMPEIRSADVSYTKPEIAAAAVTPVGIPAIPGKPPKMPELAVAQVPAAVVPQVQAYAYSAPELPDAVLPEQMQAIEIPERTFEGAIEPLPVPEAPVLIHAPQKDFQEVDHDVRQFPEIAAVTIPEPDINEIVQALLQSIKK